MAIKNQLAVGLGPRRNDSPALTGPFPPDKRLPVAERLFPPPRCIRQRTVIHVVAGAGFEPATSEL